MNDPKIRVKVIAERDGKQFALCIPAIIDSDGELTITLTQAVGAAAVLGSEAYPENVVAIPMPRG